MDSREPAHAASSAVGFIQFTYCDHDAEQFVTLGRTPAMAPADLMAFFEALPPPNDPDSPFLADLWSDGDCHDDDRAVSAAAIETVLGAPLDVLLAQGRAENGALQAEIARRLKSRASAERPPSPRERLNPNQSDGEG